MLTRIIFLSALFCSGTLLQAGQFIKKKSLQPSLSTLKQESLYELQAILKQSIEMVEALTHLQKITVEKIEEIITQETKNSFSDFKKNEWYAYFQNLATLKNQVHTSCSSQHVWATSLKNNFSKKA